jgi:hypothetical protein
MKIRELKKTFVILKNGINSYGKVNPMGLKSRRPIGYFMGKIP